MSAPAPKLRLASSPSRNPLSRNREIQEPGVKVVTTSQLSMTAAGKLSGNGQDRGLCIYHHVLGALRRRRLPDRLTL